jgi:hypothetical protein
MSCCCAFGQYSNIQTKNGSEFPTVVFSCSRRQANPPYYSIAVDPTGDATYESIPTSVSQTGLPYTVEFFASNATRTEIFQIAENLHFFQGHIKDSTSAQSGGTHSLVFIDGDTRNQAKYHEPSDPRVLALTSLFEKISNTLEFGRRLKIMEQSNPGGIEAELQQMMQMMQAQQLAEMQAVTPVLQQIEADSNLSEGSHQRARSILASLNSE